LTADANNFIRCSGNIR